MCAEHFYSRSGGYASYGVQCRNDGVLGIEICREVERHKEYAYRYRAEIDSVQRPFLFLWQKAEVVIDYPAENIPQLLKRHIYKRDCGKRNIRQLIMIHYQIAACGKRYVFERLCARVVTADSKPNVKIFLVRNIFSLGRRVPMLFYLAEEPLDFTCKGGFLFFHNFLPLTILIINNFTIILKLLST